MKVWDADATITALKCKLREATEEGDEKLAAFTAGCLMILQKMPTLDVDDGISCDRCFFYDAQVRRCTHRNGLGGKIRPKMYCCYGSYHYEPTTEEEDNDDFSEFEEETGNDI